MNSDMEWSNARTETLCANPDRRITWNYWSGHHMKISTYRLLCVSWMWGAKSTKVFWSFRNFHFVRIIRVSRFHEKPCKLLVSWQPFRVRTVQSHWRLYFHSENNLFRSLVFFPNRCCFYNQFPTSKGKEQWTEELRLLLKKCFRKSFCEQ